MIEIKEFISKLTGGNNVKYAVLACIGIMLLIASSSLGRDTTAGFNTKLERRLTQVLSQIDGVGEVTVMISCKNNEPEGVIIVAQGAENPAVKKTINDATATALNVKPHKVEVFSKREEK